MAQPALKWQIQSLLIVQTLGKQIHCPKYLNFCSNCIAPPCYGEYFSLTSHFPCKCHVLKQQSGLSARALSRMNPLILFPVIKSLATDMWRNIQEPLCMSDQLAGHSRVAVTSYRPGMCNFIQYYSAHLTHHNPHEQQIKSSIGQYMPVSEQTEDLSRG